MLLKHIRDANGTVTEVLYVARDITGEKKQEFEYQEQLKKIAQENGLQSA